MNRLVSNNSIQPVSPKARKTRRWAAAVVAAAVLLAVAIGLTISTWGLPGGNGIPSANDSNSVATASAQGAQKQVPAIVIQALETVMKVPAHRARVDTTLTSATATEGMGTQARTWAYDVLYDPQKGISTEATLGQAQTTDARVSVDLPQFLQSVRDVWRGYQTEEVVVDGRPCVKITGVLGDTGVTGALWIDPETRCVTGVEASGPNETTPSLKIRVEYGKWGNVLVLREATIESGGQRALLRYSDYQLAQSTQG